MKFLVFSKRFEHLSLEEMAATIAGLGLDGFELAVRGAGHALPEAAAGTAGHVTPDRVRADLPRAVEACRAHGLEIGWITTDITSAASPHACEVIAVASECGIRQFKLGYHHYRGFGHLRRQLDEMRRDLESIERLCLKYQIQAGVHVHAGYCLSAEAMQVERLLANFEPAALGIYADLGHMGLEGAYGGWVQSLDLISERLIMLSLKNVGLFPYSGEEDDGRRSHVRLDPHGATGETFDGEISWESKFVPLKEGITPYREAFKYLKQIGYGVGNDVSRYASFHTEYQGAWSWRELSYPELLAQLEEDVAYVRQIVGELEM